MRKSSSAAKRERHRHDLSTSRGIHVLSPFSTHKTRGSAPEKKRVPSVAMPLTYSARWLRACEGAWVNREKPERSPRRIEAVP
eukprot:6207472-Pleurochrysis_carterae.AAC.4